MSVLSCGRRGCREIMCRHLILYNKYYICTDCLEELRQLKNEWPVELTQKQVEDRIEGFMCSQKSNIKILSREEIDGVFESLISVQE